MQNVIYLILVFALIVSSCTKPGGLAPSSNLLEDTAPPSAPVSLAASPGNSVVTLTWQSGGVDSLSATYTVLRSQSSGTAYAELSGCTNLALLSCTDLSALNGVTYYYVVRAKNSVGTSLNSNEVSATPSNATSPPGSFTYSNSSPSYTVNVLITNNTPTATGGGPITSWSITPNLTVNTGLTFNTATGVISGTPTVVSNPGVNYTITAINAYGTSTANLLITVATGVVAPTISYSGTYTYQAGQTPSSAITPTLGGGTPTSCSSSPSLPTGLSINSTTCVISGTPTATASQQVYTITAANSGGSATATVSIGVLAAGANNIALTGVTSFTTSACTLLTLTSRDVFGNASVVNANTNFALSGAGSNGSFYSDSGCTTSTSNVVIASGSSSVAFYYRKTTSGSATLTATLVTPVSPALGSANRNVNVSISTPAKIGLSVSATGTTVSCNAVNLSVLDSSDNVVNATSALTINLSGTSSASFFSNSTCASAATTAAIAAGGSSATVYMRKTSVGSSNLTAAASGMGSGTGTINISLAPAGRIIFSAPPAVPYSLSTCQAYTLQTRDSLNNNTSAVSADTTVALSGVSDGSFYSNSTCTAGNEITSTIITNGTSSKVIYYSKPTSTSSVPGANITLTGTVTEWIPNIATTSVSVSSGSPTNLATANAAVGVAASTSTQVATASKCVLTTVRAQDELNALVPASRVLSAITANLSGGGAGAQFWSNSTCTTPTSTVTINAGANTGNFYYSSSTTTSTVAVNWTNGGLSGSGGSRNVTVSSGLPSRLTWTAAPTSFNTNTCQTYTFNVRDPNTVTAIGTNVSSATDFQLSDSSDGTFYSAAGCSTPISTIQVASGAQTATFYYRKLTASSATLSVALQSPVSPAISTLTQAVTVSAPAPVPNNILISASPSSSLVATQSCSLLTLQSRNGTTAANVTSNTAVTLSASNGGQFYLDSGCTAVATPSLTLVSGTNSKSGLYVSSANTGSVLVSGTASITVNSLTLNYAAPPPTMLILSGPVLLNAGTSCGAYTVTTQDSLGIDRNVTANATISLSSTGSVAVQFYTDSTCSTPAPSNQVVVPSGASSAQFYIQGNSSGAAAIQATSPGLTSAGHSMTLQ